MSCKRFLHRKTTNTEGISADIELSLAEGLAGHQKSWKDLMPGQLMHFVLHVFDHIR